MDAWRDLARELFQNHPTWDVGDPETTVWWLLFDLKSWVVPAHEAGDRDLLHKIYRFAEWCHSQKATDPDVWMAAYMAFYEHLVEDPVTYAAIPEWLTPAVFEDVLPQYEDRLDNREKYPFEQPGSFADLLRMYDSARGTSFLDRIQEWKSPGPNTA